MPVVQLAVASLLEEVRSVAERAPLSGAVALVAGLMAWHAFVFLVLLGVVRDSADADSCGFRFLERLIWLFSTGWVRLNACMGCSGR